MSTKRAHLLACLAVYGIAALAVATEFELRSWTPVLAGCGLASILAGVILRQRPALGGVLLGRSPVGNVLSGVAFLGLAAAGEDLVTGPAKVMAGWFCLACLLIGCVVDIRARRRIRCPTPKA
jgi:hypothetical protein